MFEQSVNKIIKRHGLLRPGAPVIVAVSGGADSVALLTVLKELGYDCRAAHCNFHLRGEESNRDMRHVEILTERLGIDLYVKEFDVADRMKQTGESIEMACRELRYQWFHELLDRDRAQAIAVGHHVEDQLETFFLNLFRGSGLTGLAGMRHRSDYVIRPLLDVTRSQIEEYLKEKHIVWVDDSTNASNDFARNKVRNCLLPFIESIFPDASNRILRSMQILRENEGFYAQTIREKKSTYFNSMTGEANLMNMIRNEAYAPLILFEILKSEGFNRYQTDDMIQASANSGGKFRAGKNHVREIDHGFLRAAHADSNVDPSAVDVSLSRDILRPVKILISSHYITEFRPERNPKVIYLDEKVLREDHVWQIRPWHRGDRMIPFGMTESKLLSDIFANAKLSASQKSDIQLLTCDGQIVWAIGLRASALFSIGPSARRFLRLEFRP